LQFPDGGDFDNGANQFSPDANNVTTINFGATSAENAGEGTTQYGTQFDINELNQDGYTTGRISTIDVDKEGRVFARYTNGQSSILGQVAMASFNNVQGLRPLGDNNWAATFAAGDPVYSAAGTGDLGTIQSSALEASNVDLATELVGLIIAQRNFEANSKTISTSDQMTQTVLQIKR
jgi:flagellar hook protein FlgE